MDVPPAGADVAGGPGVGGGSGGIGVSMLLGSARCQAAAMRALVGAGRSEGSAAGCRCCRGAGPVARLDGHSLQGRQATVAAAAAALQEGNLVALPTDTIYGVACLVQNSRALEAIYRLKGRDTNKPLAICLAEVEQIYRYCSVRVPDELLRDLLPGPVTLVLERSEALNKDLNPFTPLVGVRIPNHWFVQELARACGSPLALTSANISNQTSALAVTEFQELWPHLSLIVDGGPIGDVQSPECRLGSTVVDLSVPGKFRIIRTGCALTSTLDILMTKYGLKSDLPAL